MPKRAVFKSASEVNQWCHATVQNLIPTRDSKAALYRELHATSGLTIGFLHKWFDGRRPNPTMNTLDQLQAALEALVAAR